ncbi:MAG: hypothetical protein IJV24_01445 [Prevotella sp.]|nr:hypothetical protein [Prevotella sp.]
MPVIYALNNSNYESMLTLSKKVKAGTINADEIAVLVEFTKQSGGIEYAEQRMRDFYTRGLAYIDENVKKTEIREALAAYLDYVMLRRY